MKIYYKSNLITNTIHTDCTLDSGTRYNLARLYAPLPSALATVAQVAMALVAACHPLA
jgi:hypothetical protein